MPTGYTAPIEEGDGISFEGYILGCAKAFGACITMRDSPHDTPIPEKFEPNSYNTKELQEARKSKVKLEKMSDTLAQELADREFKAAKKQRAKSKREFTQINARYEEMLVYVRAWTPPSPDHVELKVFMEEQIMTSKKYIGIYPEEPPIQENGLTWKARGLINATEDIKYHTKELNAEISRVATRNLWIKQLRESLNDA